MKHRERWIIAGMVAVTMLVTCSVVLILALLAPSATGEGAPTGIYVCTAPEFGMLTGTGWFEIEGGGRITDKISGERVRWNYDPAARRFVFKDGLGIVSAVWEPESEELTIRLKEGVTRAHVEDGLLHCRRDG
jgi:hypothetical protein